MRLLVATDGLVEKQHQWVVGRAGYWQATKVATMGNMREAARPRLVPNTHRQLGGRLALALVGMSVEDRINAISTTCNALL